MKTLIVALIFMISLAILSIEASRPASADTFHVTITTGSAISKDCVTTNNCFDPNILKINPGDTVIWTNEDNYGHTTINGHLTDNVTGTVWDSSLIKAGSTYSFTFQNAGTYNYFCQVHPWMTGEVIVGNGISASPPTTSSPITSPPPPSQVTSPPMPISVVSSYAESYKGYFPLGSEFPDALVWTDKDHYQQGDTVNISALIWGPCPGMVNIKLIATVIPKPSDWLHATRFENNLGTINVINCTFSKTIVLSRNLFHGSGLYGISVDYNYAGATTGVMPLGGSPFTVENVADKMNLFQLTLNKTSSNQITYAISASDNQTYTHEIQNGYGIITRLVDPEGIVRYIQNPYLFPHFTLTPGLPLYGRYQLETTYGVNLSTVNFEIPRPTPTILISLDKLSYVKTENIGLRISVVNKAPNEAGFSYQILDPNQNIVLSKDDSLVSKLGDITDDNAIGVVTIANYIWIPTNSFPNIDGSYTVKVNYQGIEKTSSFQFVHYSKAFEEQQLQNQVQSIIDNFTQSMDQMSPKIVKLYLGNDKYSQYVDITTGQPKNPNDLIATMEFAKQGYKAFIWYSDKLRDQAIAQIRGLGINDTQKNNAISEINSRQENYIYSGLSTYNQMAQNLVNPLLAQSKSTAQINQVDEQELRQEIANDMASRISENGQSGHQINKIPHWVKTVTEWWSSGKISNDEFVRTVQYLVQTGIIQLKS